MNPTITDSTRGRARPETRYHARMTREKFIAKCAKRSNSTPEHVLAYHEIVPCECGKKKCPGWRAVYKLRNRRRREGGE